MAGRSYLMGNIGAGICDVPASLCEDPLMIVAIEEGIFGVFAVLAPSRCRSRGNSVRFETGVLEDDNQATSALLLGSRFGHCGLHRHERRVRICGDASCLGVGQGTSRPRF